MSTGYIEIEIDEEARREGFESLKKEQGSSTNTWKSLIVSLISGIDLPTFLEEHGSERVSPYTTVREYLTGLKLHGLLVEKGGKTSIKASVLQDLPTYKQLAEKEIAD